MVITSINSNMSMSTSVKITILFRKQTIHFSTRWLKHLEHRHSWENKSANTCVFTYLTLVPQSCNIRALNNFIWGSKFAGVIEGLRLTRIHHLNHAHNMHKPIVPGHPIRTSQVVCSSSQLYNSKCITLKSNTCRFGSIAPGTKVAKVEHTLYHKARWLQANSTWGSLILLSRPR